MDGRSKQRLISTAVLLPVRFYNVGCAFVMQPSVQLAPIEIHTRPVLGHFGAGSNLFECVFSSFDVMF